MRIHKTWPCVRCPSCDRLASIPAEPGDNNAPRPGDVSVCFHCAARLVFTDNLSIRVMTVPEYEALTPWMRDTIDLLAAAARVRARAEV